MKRWIANIARTLLGLTFIFSGAVKAIDPLGTTYKIEDYFKAFGGLFNTLLPTAEVLAICLIVFEFTLGVCLLLNVFTRYTSWLALLMMLVMTPITLYLAIANPITDCGCFGDAVKLTNWQTFWKNIVLLALVVALLLTKDSLHNTFRTWVEWLITALAIILVGLCMCLTLHSLPCIDFRPYKVGNYLPALMEYPEGAETDVYQTTFIYEKDGVQQEFDLSNYPKGDPDWKFVDQKTVLLKKGYEPPIHDFEIMTEDFEDVTDDVLDAPVAVLVVMYDLKKTNIKQIQGLEKLFDTCYQEELPIYMLTGSTFDDIEQFVNAHFGERADEFYQNFYTCDPVTLKTIVRANPGGVVLQYGEVYAKENLNTEEHTDTFIGKVKEAKKGLEYIVFEIDMDGDTEEATDDDFSETENYTDSDTYTDEQDFTDGD